MEQQPQQITAREAELIALLREARSLTFGFYKGSAYIRAPYVEKQNELAARIDAALSKASS